MITLVEKYDALGGADAYLIPEHEYAGKTVYDMIPARVRESDVVLEVIHNNVSLTDEQSLSIYLKYGDTVSFRIVPADPYGITVWIVFNIVVPLVIGIALNYIINAIVGSPKKPRSRKESATYGFDTPQNTTSSGSPINIVYGKIRVAGHILQAKTKILEDGNTALYMLIGLGEGGEVGWQSICGFTEDVDDKPAPASLEINGNPATSYKDITVSVRLGTKHQSIIPGFEDTVIQIAAFESEVVSATPFLYSTANNVDAIEVKLRFAQGLFNSSRDGLRAKEVQYRVRHRRTGDLPWLNTIEKSVRAKSTSEVTVAFRLDNLNLAKYDIEITRLTPDDSSTLDRSMFQVVEVDEVIYDDLAYTGKALIGVKAVATDQLHGSQPNVTSLCEATKVKVYTSEDEFTYKYTNNPAWIILDILLNSRYGLGALIDKKNVLTSSFITAANSCGALEFNEDRTAQEARSQCDVVIDDFRSSWDWVYTIAQAAFLSVYKLGGKYSIKADEESAPVMLFTGSNVRNFKMGYTAPSERINYVDVHFFDRDQNYTENTIVAIDSEVDGIENYVKETIELTTVTRRSEALRNGVYRINANKFLTRYATWDSDIQAIRCEPNDVVSVAYENVLWGLNTGRVKSATITAIYTNQKIIVEAGKVYNVQVWHDDYSSETSTLANIPGEHDIIVVQGTFTKIPAEDSLYVVGEVNLLVKNIKIIDVKRKTDLTATIYGVEYNKAVYDRTQVISLPPPSDSVGIDARKAPPDISNLKLTERIIEQVDGSLSINLEVSWSPSFSPIANGYYVWLKLSSHAGFTTSPVSPLVKGSYYRITSDVIVNDTYDITVTPVSIFGVRKDPSLTPIASITIRGNTNRPSDVTGFTVTRIGGTLYFNWNAVPELDIKGYEIRNGQNWDSGIVIVSNWSPVVYETNVFFSDTVNTISQKFLVKACNTSNNFSVNAASIVIVIDPRIDANVLVTRNEKLLDFPGTTSNITVAGSNPNKYLELNDATAPYLGTYETAEIDLAGAFRSYVSTFIEAEQVDTTLTWADATFTWGSEIAANRTWQGPANSNNLTVLLEAKYDTASPITTSYAEFSPVEKLFRYARFKITLGLADNKFLARIKEFRMLFDVPDIFASGEGVSVTGNATINYGKTFTLLSSISLQVTGRDLVDAEHLVIPVADRTLTNFKVKILLTDDSSESGSLRKIDWFARGY